MVSTALYTGLSGLRVHQTYIDVIGNNLANVSTPGFRGSRATFSDILSFTVRTGSGPNGNFGGVNPLQIGHGALIGSIDADLNQGTFQDTGRSLDVALQGRGFFTLNNGVQNFYTRVGTFGIDANRNLVDTRSGMRVVNTSGTNITIPTSDTLPAVPTSRMRFQGNLPATVGGPLREIVQSSSVFKQGVAATKTASVAASSPSHPQFDLSSFVGTSNKTLMVAVNGGAQQTITFDAATFGAGPVSASTIANRFSQVTGLQVTADDLAGTIGFDTIKLGAGATLKFDDGAGSSGLLAALGMNATLNSGSETPATGSTDLSMLTARNAAYANGDPITVSGTNADGTAFSDTFVYGTSGTTLQHLVAFINSTINGSQAQATLETDGSIRLTAQNAGEASLSLFVGDGAGTNRINWPNFTLSQNGTGPDTAVTSIDVVDSQGRTHPVSLTFTRSAGDSRVWDLTATVDPSSGTVNQGSIGQIRFNDNGSFNVIGGGSNSLTFSWNGISTQQSVTVDLGQSGQFDGVSLLGNSTTVAAVDQNGYGVGTLLNVGFDATGQLVGYYSNGQSNVIDQLRISMFSNEGGLVRSGDTLFSQSPNSDDAISTTANAAGAGTVRSGQLENSNVDIAREFVNLIEAQRGFQANSRVITTTDEILAELMNIVR